MSAIIMSITIWAIATLQQQKHLQQAHSSRDYWKNNISLKQQYQKVDAILVFGIIPIQQHQLKNAKGGYLSQNCPCPHQQWNIMIKDIPSPKHMIYQNVLMQQLLKALFPISNSTIAILKSSMLFGHCIIRLLVTFTALNIGIWVYQLKLN
jgi:hypothetical protein